MLIDTKKSPYAKAWGIPQDALSWTEGFWKERFDTCAQTTIPHILGMFEDKDVFHVLENFLIAAGDAEGTFDGTPYGDGDLYKLLEGAMYAWAKNHDEAISERIDYYIGLIGRAQQPDGYISTKQIIGERQNNGVKRQGDIDDFEVYNFGHMFTAACMHKRITGKDSFLEIACKAADYLEQMYQESAKNDEVQTAVCPSHYMGLVELYRTTGKQKYLELAHLAVRLRDSVKNGTDDNQDRLPLKEHIRITGHAVRSTYLYGGAADLYLETGDEDLKQVLHDVWTNMTTKKIYVNGGCGALYNGVSPYGIFPNDQKMHQAFGYEYQLPNVTAYNETCGALGSIFWNHRMFAIEPKAVFFDNIERAMYNLALAAISLDGDKYFYENMLRRTKKLDYELIWPLSRAHYILCFCCPTNLSRTIMEALEYTYMQSADAVYTGLYGGSEARLALDNGSAFTLVQETGYPYDGAIRFSAKDVRCDTAFTLKVRVPGWVQAGSIKTGSQTIQITKQHAGQYIDLIIEKPSEMNIEAIFDMPVRYTIAHPMVEEDTNQVAVERGPLVYCMETPDAGTDTLDDIYLLSNADFETKPIKILGREVVALITEAGVLIRENYDPDALYQTMQVTGMKKIPVQLIPYFAWDNRGMGEMKIWMPVHYQF